MEGCTTGLYWLQCKCGCMPTPFFSVLFYFSVTVEIKTQKTKLKFQSPCSVTKQVNLQNYNTMTMLNSSFI
jgi:hypothetical protein